MCLEACLTWQDGIVRRLARDIYDTREFQRLPMLADALEEAGLACEEVLRHLRWQTLCPDCCNQPLAPECPTCRGAHWLDGACYSCRGDWAMDLLL